MVSPEPGEKIGRWGKVPPEVCDVERLSVSQEIVMRRRVWTDRMPVLCHSVTVRHEAVVRDTLCSCCELSEGGLEVLS